MKRLAGQAGSVFATFLQRIGMLVMTLLLALLLGAGALAYRLSLGPLQIPWLATRLANAVSGRDVQVHIAQAALAWQGYKKGSLAPLFLQLGGIALRETDGSALADIPDAQLAFSLGGLFAGRTPIYVASRNAHIAFSGAPVSLLAGIRLGAAFTLASADLWITLGSGQVGPSGFGEPVQSGRFQVTVTPDDIRLTDGALTLTPYGQSAPVVRVTGAAHREGGWRGAVTVSADAVQAADLHHYWPAQAVPLTRHWVAANITSGSARDARFTLQFAAPPHLADTALTGAQGGFQVQDATLIWMQGVQPLTGLSGAFRLTDMDDIDITAATGKLGGITLAAATMHIGGVAEQDQDATLEIPVSGTVQDAFAVLNGPGLQLMRSVPQPVPRATGGMTGTVKLSLPLQGDISVNTVRLNVATRLSDVVLPLPVPGLTLTQGSFAIGATLHRLQVVGAVELAGEPAHLQVAAGLDAANAPVVLDLSGTVTQQTLKQIGWDPGGLIAGKMPVQVHVATGAGNGGSLTVRADLAPAAMALPEFGWSKPAGAPGKFSFAADINGDAFSGIDRITRIVAQAPNLDVETSVDGRVVELSQVRIGDTEGAGRIVAPAAKGAPWQIRLTGNALDLSSLVNPPPATPAAAAAEPAARKLGRPQPPTGFLWDATAHFGRLKLAASPEPGLRAVDFDGNGQGGFIFRAEMAAQVEGAKPVILRVSPIPGSAPGEAEDMTLQTDDGGALLRALGAFDDLQGGKLDLSAEYGIGEPITGRTQITGFRLLNAPVAAKLLQAVTVLGIPEAASGPGLLFAKMILPYSIDDGVITLTEARAFSASLGFTASGTIDLGASRYDIHGTVVPAYALNTLPGKIPLLGKLFSPEKGGGLFAMRYSMTGPFADPKVKVNPLSALTPGFLRGIFGLPSAARAK